MHSPLVRTLLGLARHVALPVLVVLLARPAVAQPFGVSIYEPDGTLRHRFLATMTDMHVDDLEIGPDGNIWLARADNSHSSGVPNPNDMIAIFDMTGQELGIVNGGGMRHPTAVTWDGTGAIYVAGEENDFRTNVYKYDVDGTFLFKFRTAGWNLIDVYNDLVTTADDRIYAAAWWGTGSADQMTEFDTGGGTVNTFSATGPTYFHRDMTLDGNDTIWVRTPKNGPGADLIRAFSLAGTQTGSFSTDALGSDIIGLRAGDAGNLFTYDRSERRLLEIDTSGNLLSTLALPDLPDWVTDFTFAADGAVLVAHQLPDYCVEDLDDSGAVDFGDILAILSAWGPCDPYYECPEDLDASDAVDFGDILAVLSAWGPCEL